MSNTQPNGGDKSKSGNAGKLKPLNISGRGKRRTRRTSEQKRQSEIEREIHLAEKSSARAAKYAERVRVAQEKARVAQERAEAIKAEAERTAAEKAEQARLATEQDQREQKEAQMRANSAPDENAGNEDKADEGNKQEVAAKSKPAPARAENGSSTTAMLKKIGNDFNDFYKTVNEKYGVSFSSATPRLTKRGFITLKLKGELAPRKNPINVTSPVGVAREAVRFIQFYKQVGLTPQWLNKEVKFQDDDNTYIVAGLRGKSHSVVLRKVGTDEAFTMSPIDFKKSVEH